MEKLIGIWIDKRTAKIVTYQSSKETFFTIKSDVEEFNVKGGSGTRFKGGPQDVVHDSKYLEKEKHHYKNYFNKIYNRISDAKSIVIFGPAQTGEKLKKELSESYTEMEGKIIEFIRADSMTDNEIISWVKKYYNL